MGNAWEIGSHTFSIKSVVFFIRLPSGRILHHMGNAWVSRQFPKAWEIAGKPIEWEKPENLISRKILQNPSYVENLGNCYSYFSHTMGAFFQLDSHTMYTL